MKLKKILLAFATFAFVLSALPQKSVAQTSFGASYEIREKDPTKGYGARIESRIFKGLPVVQLSLRAHFSYFNDKNNLTTDGAEYSADITNYDYGLAAVGGVEIGPIAPYVGLGLGASTLDVTREDLQNAPGAPSDQSSKDSSIYWNGFVGAKITALPIQPFVEYRLKEISNYKDELSDIQNSDGRMIFGVAIEF